MATATEGSVVQGREVDDDYARYDVRKLFLKLEDGCELNGLETMVRVLDVSDRMLGIRKFKPTGKRGGFWPWTRKANHREERENYTREILNNNPSLWETGDVDDALVSLEHRDACEAIHIAVREAELMRWVGFYEYGSFCNGIGTEKLLADFREDGGEALLEETAIFMNVDVHYVLAGSVRNISDVSVGSMWIPTGASSTLKLKDLVREKTSRQWQAKTGDNEATALEKEFSWARYVFSPMFIEGEGSLDLENAVKRFKEASDKEFSPYVTKICSTIDVDVERKKKMGVGVNFRLEESNKQKVSFDLSGLTSYVENSPWLLAKVYRLLLGQDLTLLAAEQHNERFEQGVFDEDRNNKYTGSILKNKLMALNMAALEVKRERNY